MSHVMYKDELQPVAVVIPVYLPITLRVATGFVSRETTAFNLWTQALGRLTSIMTHRQPLRLCQGLYTRSHNAFTLSPDFVCEFSPPCLALQIHTN